MWCILNWNIDNNFTKHNYAKFGDLAHNISVRLIYIYLYGYRYFMFLKIYLIKIIFENKDFENQKWNKNFKEVGGEQVKILPLSSTKKNWNSVPVEQPREWSGYFIYGSGGHGIQHLISTVTPLPLFFSSNFIYFFLQNFLYLSWILLFFNYTYKIQIYLIIQMKKNKRGWQLSLPKPYRTKRRSLDGHLQSLPTFNRIIFWLHCLQIYIRISCNSFKMFKQ